MITPEKTVKLVANNRLREWFKVIFHITLFTKVKTFLYLNFQDENGRVPRHLEFVAAGSAGLIQSIITTPNEAFTILCQVKMFKALS